MEGAGLPPGYGLQETPLVLPDLRRSLLRVEVLQEAPQEDAKGTDLGAIGCAKGHVCQLRQRDGNAHAAFGPSGGTPGRGRWKRARG